MLQTRNCLSICLTTGLLVSRLAMVTDIQRQQGGGRLTCAQMGGGGRKVKSVPEEVFQKGGRGELWEQRKNESWHYKTSICWPYTPPLPASVSIKAVWLFKVNILTVIKQKEGKWIYLFNAVWQKTRRQLCSWRDNKSVFTVVSGVYLTCTHSVANHGLLNTSCFICGYTSIIVCRWQQLWWYETVSVGQARIIGACHLHVGHQSSYCKHPDRLL